MCICPLLHDIWAAIIRLWEGLPGIEPGTTFVTALFCVMANEAVRREHLVTLHVSTNGAPMDQIVSHVLGESSSANLAPPVGELSHAFDSPA